MQVQISTLQYNEPFTIYLCDSSQTTCIYINTIFSFQIPYTFTVPPILVGLENYTLKAVDVNGCEITQLL